MSKFHLQSQNQTGLGSGRLLSAKVQTSKDLPMCAKRLPIWTQPLSVTPFPLVNTAFRLICLPLARLTFLSLFFNVTKVKFLAFPSQAEPNTAPTGFEECVTMTLVSG